MILSGNKFIQNSGYETANSINIIIENPEMQNELKNSIIRCGSNNII